eukprot:258528_1
MKKMYPITYGVLECINLDIGYSVFALQYLPPMLTWMKNIKSRLNQRINMEDIQQNGDKYNGQWVLDECEKNRWGDSEEWSRSLDGFVSGWNHIAYRVTTDREKQGSIIDAKKKKDNIDDEHEDGKDDEKEEKKDESVQQNQEEIVEEHTDNQTAENTE